MNSTNLLLITSEFPPQPGGIGNHAFHLAKTLQCANQECTVLTDYRSSEGTEEEVFDAAQNMPIHRIKRYTWLPWTYLKRVFKAVRLAASSDVVLLSGKFSLWLGGLLALLVNRPMIAILHGSELNHGNKRVQKFTRYCLQKMAVVIGVSRYTLSLVEDVPLKHSLVINNGFEIPAPSAWGGMTKSVGSDKEVAIKLITVGNLTQRKGQHNVIGSLPIVSKEFPKVEYHMVGIPTNAKSLKQQAQDLGVADRIKVYGKVSEEKKWQLLSEAHIFIMLSEATETGDVEGFGIAILEANASGLPAIGSRGCGIEDAIDQGVSGFLVDAKKPEEVVAAVKEIMANYSVFSHQAKEWSQGFHWDKVGEQYQSVINELLKESE